MNNNNITGFSIIEVMIASLLFSIILLGFVSYQQALITKHRYFSTTLQANQIAFQLLDSYPYSTVQIAPNDWQYNIQSILFNNQCKMVVVKVTSPNHKQIQQQRLFCD